MRTQILVAMLALPGLAVLNLLSSASAMRAFLADVPMLATSHDVGRFKQLVAKQMYAALVQIGLLGTPLLLLFYGFARHVLKPTDALVYLLLPSVVVLVLGARFKRLERQVKEIPTADDELASERDAVVATWMRKPLPDW